jgi:hypothetical protein
MKGLLSVDKLRAKESVSPRVQKFNAELQKVIEDKCDCACGCGRKLSVFDRYALTPFREPLATAECANRYQERPKNIQVIDMQSGPPMSQPPAQCQDAAD